MGNCASGEYDSEFESRLTHLRQLDKDVQSHATAHHERDEQIAKLLLLGAGESGKSTLFRQMIKLFGKGFTEEMRQSYRNAIIDGILSNLRHLLEENAEHKEEEFRLSSETQTVASIAASWSTDSEPGPEQARMIRQIWDDPAMKRTFERRKNVLVPESAAYFFDKVESICVEDYVPSDEDLLLMRVRTTGMVREEFFMKPLRFALHDVGGQRNERKKWINLFDGVTAILFVTAISEYDMICFEDESTNRVIESLDVFEQTFNQYFPSTPIILFLNKKDLFDAKFYKVPLSEHFPEFDGSTPDDGYKFFHGKFREKLNRKRDMFFVHVTTATNSDNCQKVFQAMQHIVIQIQLGDGGFV